MDAIFQDSKDVYVANYKIYDDGDGKACSDADATVQLTTSELKELFVKGAVIILADDSLAVPVGYAEAEGIGTVTYVTADGTDTLASKADPE